MVNMCSLQACIPCCWGGGVPVPAADLQPLRQPVPPASHGGPPGPPPGLSPQAPARGHHSRHPLTAASGGCGLGSVCE